MSTTNARPIMPKQPEVECVDCEWEGEGQATNSCPGCGRRGLVRKEINLALVYESIARDQLAKMQGLLAGLKITHPTLTATKALEEACTVFKIRLDTAGR